MSGQPTSATLTAGRVMSPMQMAYEFGILKQQFLQLLGMLGIDQNGTMPEWLKAAKSLCEEPAPRINDQQQHGNPGTTKPRKG